MSKPLRTNNPSEWTALDGIYIDEIRPPGRITTKGSAVVCIVGQFEKGTYSPTRIISSAHLLNEYGTGNYSGFKSLMSKSFSNLVIKRLKATGAKKAFGYLVDNSATPKNIVMGEAKTDGLYGNEISMSAKSPVSATAGKFDLEATLGAKTQIFRDLDLESFPIQGEFAVFTKVTDAATIPNVTTTQTVTFSQGSDGTPSDSDYTTALAELELYEPITIVFADKGGANVNNALILHCNKMARYPVLHEEVGTTVDQAKTAVSGYRAALDRGSLAFPWLYQYNYLTDKTELSNPAAWAASVLSLIPEEWDPSVTDAAQYLAGVKGLEMDLGREDYIELKNAGIMAFEFDEDYGYKIKSGVTLSTDASLCMVFRRRVSDLITNDISSGLKPYQGRPMNEDNKDDVLGAVTKYLEGLKGKKRIQRFDVDGVSMNTPDTEANGEFHILIFVRLYASMRYIVLHAQIGEGVTITEVQGRAA